MDIARIAYLDLMRQKLRRDFLAWRNRISFSILASLSLLAQQEILALKQWQDAKTVALYLSLKNELATDLLIERAKEAKKNILLPRVLNQEAMDFVLYQSEADLEIANFGLKQARQSLLACELCPDFMLIPGLVFDYFGNRLGFGKGYYDRYLAKLQAKEQHLPYLVGFAFECQIIPYLPSKSWDMPLNALCSPKRCLEIK